MSCWIKLETGFYSHRKTIRLHSIIGDAAFWVVPRLWCLAAEQQPDGDFSDYTAKELAMLIGYLGDAPSMLQALLQAGFLDEGQKLHGWIERNAFHVTNRDRATKAALARWRKLSTTERGDKRRGEESIEHCSSNAPSITTPPISKEQFFALKDLRGWPIEAMEQFWNENESVGWIAWNKQPIVKAEPAFVAFLVKWMARRNGSGAHEIPHKTKHRNY